MDFKKKREQEVRPEDIDIKSFIPIVVPTVAGGFTIMLWGLGTDNRMYMWESAKKVWLI